MQQTDTLSDGSEQTDAERSLSEMLEIMWDTDWSDLPTDAESHVESAFEHLTTARDVTERDRTVDPMIDRARRARSELLTRDDVHERTKDELRTADPEDSPREILSLAVSKGIETDDNYRDS